MIISGKKLDRGMSLFTDLKDWLGGYPFETATPNQIQDEFKKDFNLINLKTVGKKLGVMNLFLKKIISKIIIKLIIPIYKIFYNQKVNDLKFLIGNSFLKTERYNYNKYKHIEESYYRIFSQNSEDGVLDYLLYCLNLKDPKFCEIGTEDYQEANTRYIYEKNSGTGFIIDCISNYKFKVQKNLRLWRGNLNVIEKK